MQDAVKTFRTRSETVRAVQGVSLEIPRGGVVGTSVARELTQNAADFEARIGAPLQIVGVA